MLTFQANLKNKENYENNANWLRFKIFTHNVRKVSFRLCINKFCDTVWNYSIWLRADREASSFKKTNKPRKGSKLGWFIYDT